MGSRRRPRFLCQPIGFIQLPFYIDCIYRAQFPQSVVCEPIPSPYNW